MSKHARAEANGDDPGKRIQKLEEENARLAAELAAARDKEEQYRRLFENLPVSVYVTDSDGIITDVNLFHVARMGRGRLHKEDYIGKPISMRESLLGAGVTGRFEDVLRGIPLVAEGVYFPRVSGGGEGYFNIRGVPVKHGRKVVGAIFISEDVTMLKKIQEELSASKEQLEQLVHSRTAQLGEALERVRTLSGFLPICASCKKVRDDRGYWTQVEAYLLEHSEIEFSHGLCPDCMKKLYPDLPRTLE
jgi:PAS domain S-box-containing protein